MDAHSYAYRLTPRGTDAPRRGNTRVTANDTPIFRWPPAGGYAATLSRRSINTDHSPSPAASRRNSAGAFRRSFEQPVEVTELSNQFGCDGGDFRRSTSTRAPSADAAVSQIGGRFAE
jgi:hypothetical protein